MPPLAAGTQHDLPPLGIAPSSSIVASFALPAATKFDVRASVAQGGHVRFNCAAFASPLFCGAHVRARASRIADTGTNEGLTQIACQRGILALPGKHRHGRWLLGLLARRVGSLHLKRLEAGTVAVAQKCPTLTAGLTCQSSPRLCRGGLGQEIVCGRALS